MRRYLLTLVFALCAVPAQAQLSADDLKPLTGKALFEGFNDKTMDGVYKNPRQVSGTNKFTETFHADGNTTYREGWVEDKGMWSTDDTQICFAYTGALAGNISCFQVFQIGTCLYSYNPQAINEKGRPINANLWSVKTVTRGDLSTCDNLVS